MVRTTPAAAAPGPMARHGKSEAITALDNSAQLLDALRSQLRSQAVDIDRLEAENAEQRDVARTLGADLNRLQTIQQIDAHDLVHLASQLLALSHATGVELHNSTKALFRRRGWTATNRTPETQKP